LNWLCHETKTFSLLIFLVKPKPFSFSLPPCSSSHLKTLSIFFVFSITVCIPPLSFVFSFFMFHVLTSSLAAISFTLVRFAYSLVHVCVLTCSRSWFVWFTLSLLHVRQFRFHRLDQFENVIHYSLRFGRYRSSHLLPSFLGLVDTHFFC